MGGKPRIQPYKNCENVLEEHDFTGCGKTHPEWHEASGHDFSRAETQQNKRWALAPAVIPPQESRMFAASSRVPENRPIK
jgi:hypothetical protein